MTVPPEWRSWLWGTDCNVFTWRGKRSRASHERSVLAVMKHSRLSAAVGLLHLLCGGLLVVLGLQVEQLRLGALQSCVQNKTTKREHKGVRKSRRNVAPLHVHRSFQAVYHKLKSAPFKLCAGTVRRHGGQANTHIVIIAILAFAIA